MSETGRARAVGINHVALEVGDINDAILFYGEIFEFTLRGRGDGMAFIDLGDQFLALAEGRNGDPDTKRHFGLVVDSVDKVRRRLEQQGVEIIPGFGLNFRDPWGNRFQIIEYSGIQFTKTPDVLRGMGLNHLEKTEDARRQLAEKGMGPE